MLAFVLMVAGGLWLCLWRTRWRFAGGLAVLAGVLVAPLRPVPDILIGRDGLVAVRDKAGLLSALGPRNSSFELARMLEHDGDGRRPEDVLKAGGFRCDWAGCVTEVRGRTIVIQRQLAAHADDCRKATVIVVPGRRAMPCADASLVVDRATLARAGAYAIGVGQAAPNGASAAPLTRIVTVAETRGERPWTGSPLSRTLPAPAGAALPPGPDAGSGRPEPGLQEPGRPAPNSGSPPSSRPLDPDDDP